MTTGFKNHVTTEAIAKLLMKRAYIGPLADASARVSNPGSAIHHLISLQNTGAFQTDISSDGIFLTNHLRRTADAVAHFNR